MAKPQSLFISEDKTTFINLELVVSAEWDSSSDELLVRTVPYTHRFHRTEGERFIEQLQQLHDEIWTDRVTTTYE